MREAGFDVRMQPTGPLVYECRPAALKRVARNLLDNAVKFEDPEPSRCASQAIEISADADRRGGNDSNSGDEETDNGGKAVERRVSRSERLRLSPGVLPVGIAPWPFVTTRYPIVGWLNSLWRC